LDALLIKDDATIDAGKLQLAQARTVTRVRIEEHRRAAKVSRTERTKVQEPRAKKREEREEQTLRAAQPRK